MQSAANRAEAWLRNTGDRLSQNLDEARRVDDTARETSSQLREAEQHVRATEDNIRTSESNVNNAQASLSSAQCALEDARRTRERKEREGKEVTYACFVECIQKRCRFWRKGKKREES